MPRPRMKLSTRRGISPLIATIILIAITVIGGTLVYTIFLSTASSSTGGVSAQISGVTLSASNGLTLNVKNSGSNALTNGSTISINNATPCTIGGTNPDMDGACTGITSPIPSIAPGHTQAIVDSELAVDFGTVTITPGNSYTITFTAFDSAGSSSAFSVTVTATS